MYGFIYETKNLINGMKYIGMHKSNVFDDYLGSGKILTRAIKKYGKHNFSRSILAIAETESELAMLEIYYIRISNAVESKEYYNIHSGGFGGNTIAGYTEIEKNEYKEKMKKSCEKLSVMFKGKKRSVEDCQKIKDAVRNYWDTITDEKRRHFSEIMSKAVQGKNNPNYGNYWTDEQKTRQSKKMKGRLIWDKNGMFGKKGCNAVNGKTIYMYDINFVLVKTFNTKQMALDFLNLKGHTQFNKALKDKTIFKGYIFSLTPLSK